MPHEPATSGAAEPLHRPVVERVIARMRPADGALSLCDMADIAHLSPFHFSRTFRRVTGVAPGEFYTAMRLEKAKRLLLTTSLSVGEVCFEVGYESLGTFTTRFTRLVGVSPGRMRRLPRELDPTAAGRPPDPTTLLEAPPGGGVAFRINGLGLAPGTPVHAGLFPGAIPQRRPVAGVLLASPEGTPEGTLGVVHWISPVPDGSYHLMAAALPSSEDPLELLLPGDALRVGRAELPVLVRGGRSEGVVDVALRPLGAADPPLLISLAAGAYRGRAR